MPTATLPRFNAFHCWLRFLRTPQAAMFSTGSRQTLEPPINTTVEPGTCKCSTGRAESPSLLNKDDDITAAVNAGLGTLEITSTLMRCPVIDFSSLRCCL